MSRGRADTRSAEEWASLSEATKAKFSTAPPRSLTALVEQNLQNIELRLQRGWSIAQMVIELSDLGVKTTVPVFKNTLYRARRKKKALDGSPERRHAPPSSPEGQPVQAQVAAHIFRAKTETKKHF